MTVIEGCSIAIFVSMLILLIVSLIGFFVSTTCKDPKRCLNICIAVASISSSLMLIALCILSHYAN